MNTSEDEPLVLNQDVWRAWVHKSKLREEAASRRYRKLAAIAFAILLLVVAGFHFIAQS